MAITTDDNKTVHSMNIALIVFITLTLIAFIVLIILKTSRSKVVHETMLPSLEELYAKGSVMDNILYNENGTTSFKITSDSRIWPEQHMFTFNNITETLQITKSEMVGLVFRLRAPVVLTSLQIPAQLIADDQPRELALLLMSDKTVIARFSVSRATHVVDDCNFITGRLPVAIQLIANVQYMIAALLKAGDNTILLPTSNPSSPTSLPQSSTFVTHVVQVAPVIWIIDTIHAESSILFDVPVTPDIQNRVGPSFGFRALPINSAIFDIDVITGGLPRFPPKYLNGCNVSVPVSGANVFISAGCGSSWDDNANFVVPSQLSIASQVIGRNGIDVGTLLAGQFYYVYVISSASQGLPIGGMLSLGREQPQALPLGYDSFRRVGAVFARTDSLFEQMIYIGDSVSREALFTGNIENRRCLQLSGPTVSETSNFQTFPLQYVPVTATSVTFQIRGNTFSGSQQYNNQVPRNATIEFLSLSVVNSFNNMHALNAISLPNARESAGQVTLSLQQLLLPPRAQIHIFGNGTDGYIPNGPFPVSTFETQVFVASFTETF